MTIIWLLVGLGLIVLGPELVVSLTGAFEGNADIAIGNVVGSKTRKLGLAILLAVAGLAGLIFGGNLFVDSATDFARMLGVSDKQMSDLLGVTTRTLYNYRHDPSSVTVKQLQAVVESFGVEPESLFRV